nr:hypothetical protein [Streptomyces sp. NRRL S-31]
MTSHRAGARSLRAIDAGEARASDVAVHHREPAAVPAALQASVTVAELLRDPERVAEAAVRSLADAPGTLMLPGWQPASQLLGHAGIAMLHGRLAEEDPKCPPSNVRSENAPVVWRLQARASATLTRGSSTPTSAVTGVRTAASAGVQAYASRAR